MSLLAKDLMMEREEKCLSFLVLESDFGRESSHLHEKEKGSLPFPLLWENTVEVKDILLDKVSLLRGGFGC